MPETFFSRLRCPSCGKEFAIHEVQTFCTGCKVPLIAEYDLSAARRKLSPEVFASRPATLWRYRELLPLFDDRNIVSLGEGLTPVLPVPRLGARIGCGSLFIKEEGYNPTGSFKARGISVAVSRAVELGIRSVAMPSAGNAGGALAAYASRAAIEAHVFIPKDTPIVNQEEVGFFGARTVTVDGLISDAAAAMQKENAAGRYFDMSTMKEPYRLEGKKTMGFEIAEQFPGRLPDAILYPTGGGTGLIGMWKAFRELEELGWLNSPNPKMISVQAAGCQPIVKAFAEGQKRSEMWNNARTVASGLRVPKAFADGMILDALRESGGTAIAVDDGEIVSAMRQTALVEGILLCPEGAAAVAALRPLLERGVLRSSDTILVFNTGSGYKYREILAGWR